MASVGRYTTRPRSLRQAPRFLKGKLWNSPYVYNCVYCVLVPVLHWALASVLTHQRELPIHCRDPKVQARAGYEHHCEVLEAKGSSRSPVGRMPRPKRYSSMMIEPKIRRRDGNDIMQHEQGTAEHVTQMSGRYSTAHLLHLAGSHPQPERGRLQCDEPYGAEMHKESDEHAYGTGGHREIIYIHIFVNAYIYAVIAK